MTEPCPKLTDLIISWKDPGLFSALPRELARAAQDPRFDERVRWTLFTAVRQREIPVDSNYAVTDGRDWWRASVAPLFPPAYDGPGSDRDVCVDLTIPVAPVMHRGDGGWLEEILRGTPCSGVVAALASASLGSPERELKLHVIAASSTGMIEWELVQVFPAWTSRGT